MSDQQRDPPSRPRGAADLRAGSARGRAGPSAPAHEGAEALLTLWFGTALTDAAAARARAKRWFRRSARFDGVLRARFADWPDRALRGELDDWRNDCRCALARILALDQLPRNLYRDSAQAYAYDAAALAAAEDAVASGHDRQLPPLAAAFVYLPFEHAEHPSAQARAVALFETLEARAPEALRDMFRGFTDYARRHQAVILRFGRFPHRNAALGRQSSAEEAAYLDAGGERFAGAPRKRAGTPRHPKRRSGSPAD